MIHCDEPVLTLPQFVTRAHAHKGNVRGSNTPDVKRTLKPKHVHYLLNNCKVNYIQNLDQGIRYSDSRQRKPFRSSLDAMQQYKIMMKKD